VKTVAEIKKDLDMFDDSDLCFAYEGEVIGLVINRNGKQGVIHCSESDDNEPTELIDKDELVQPQCWMVTIDRPNYPEVFYFSCKKDAQDKRDELVAGEHSNGGRHTAQVVLARTVNSFAINTDY